MTYESKPYAICAKIRIKKRGKMRRFKRLFAVLFIVSTLLGALHEVIHDHDHHADASVEESCPLYLLGHTPVVLNDETPPVNLAAAFEAYKAPPAPHPSTAPALFKNRSPPLS